MTTLNQFGQELGERCEGWKVKKLPTKQPMYGSYCTLEPLDLDLHAAKLYEAFKFDNLGETWTYLPFGPFIDFDDFKGWLKSVSLSKMFFSIIDHQNNNSPQGLASYHDIDPEHGVIEVGSIHYSKKLQKTRSGTEAMYLMMSRVFDELDYRRYQWRCNGLNQASRKAAERLGFKFEGIFRQSNVFKGYNRDTAWYSIIDNEWPDLSIRFQKWLDPSNFDSEGCQILPLRAISYDK